MEPQIERKKVEEGKPLPDTIVKEELIWYVADEISSPPKARLTVFDIAELEGWEIGTRGVRIFGYGGRVNQVMDINGWRIFPFWQFDSIMPTFAYQRTLKLLEAKVITGLDDLFIADDLSNPKYQPPKPKPWETEEWVKVSESAGKVAKGGLTAVAVVGGVALSVLAAAASAVLLVDPVLCCRTVYKGRPTWVCYSEWWH